MPESCKDAAVGGFGDDTLILTCKADVSDLIVADFGHTENILGVRLDLSGICRACCFHLELDLNALELLELGLSGFNFLSTITKPITTATRVAIVFIGFTA